MIYALAFAGGFAGSLHCLGMCGGLVAILAAAGGPRPWRRLAIYNLARVNTLGAIGAAAGAAGTVVVTWGPLDLAERGLAVVAGLVAVAAGLEVLGVLAPRGRWVAAWLHARIGGGLRALLEAPSPWAPVAFGTANAFLPCHLIYAFAAMAAATGSIGRGALTMLAFGLGTVPAMMLPGTVRAILPGELGGRVARAAGALVVVVGLVTLARGFGVALPIGHVHHH